MRSTWPKSEVCDPWRPSFPSVPIWSLCRSVVPGVPCLRSSGLSSRCVNSAIRLLPPVIYSVFSLCLFPLRRPLNYRGLSMFPVQRLVYYCHTSHGLLPIWSAVLQHFLSILPAFPLARSLGVADILFLLKQTSLRRYNISPKISLYYKQYKCIYQ